MTNEETYILSTLADIRHKTGVGDKPMLDELADAIVQKIKDARREALEEAKKELEITIHEREPSSGDWITPLTFITATMDMLIEKENENE